MVIFLYCKILNRVFTVYGFLPRYNWNFVKNLVCLSKLLLRKVSCVHVDVSKYRKALTWKIMHSYPRVISFGCPVQKTRFPEHSWHKATKCGSVSCEGNSADWSLHFLEQMSPRYAKVFKKKRKFPSHLRRFSRHSSIVEEEFDIYCVRKPKKILWMWFHHGTLPLTLTFNFARTYDNIKPQLVTWQYVFIT